MSLLALATLFAPPSSAADLDAALQYRPRAELRTTDPAVSPSAAVTHRARLSLGFGAEELTGSFVLQDVRKWGEEDNTLTDFDANGLDLHEGFLAWNAAEGLSLKVGRQEIAMHEHRLIGTVGWTQQARSFDGMRAGGTLGALDYDLVGVVLADHPGEETTDPHVYGDLEIARLGWASPDSGRVDLLAIRDTNSATELSRVTAGIYAKGTSGILSGRVEAYVQDNNGISHMVGVQGTVKPEIDGNPSLTLWLDRLSAATGDAPAFNTLFATNHKFYGTSDLIAFSLGGPADGLGLHDIALKAGANATEQWRVLLDAHYFTTADAEMTTLGQEVDLAARRTLTDGLNLALGTSTFLYGDSAPANVWAWMLLDANC
jgi:hypothetical protein